MGYLVGLVFVMGRDVSSLSGGGRVGLRWVFFLYRFFWGFLRLGFFFLEELE